LLTFFGFPVEHWIDLRITDLTEPPFATTKGRTRKSKDTGSRKVGLAMAFKLLLSVEKYGRRLNAAHIVAPARPRVKFPNGPAEMLQVDTLGDHLLAENSLT